MEKPCSRIPNMLEERDIMFDNFIYLEIYSEAMSNYP